MIKNLLLICMLTLLCIATVTASDPTQYVIGIEDDASNNDENSADDLESDLDNIPNNDGSIKTFGQITYNDIYDQVTILIYKNNAVIVVALDGPVTDVIFASNAGVILTAAGISVKTILSSEVRSANYLELFGIETKNTNCIDTDNGINYYEAGETYLESESENEDSCSDNTLLEYYCDAQGDVSEESYDCPNGCNDGTCLIEGEIVPVVEPEVIVINETPIIIEVQNETIDEVNTTQIVNISEPICDGENCNNTINVPVEEKSFFGKILAWFGGLFN